MPGILAMSEPKLKTSCTLMNRNGSKSLPVLNVMVNFMFENPLKRCSVSMLNIPMISYQNAVRSNGSKMRASRNRHEKR
ncbi:hypothetical protein FWK35_00014566 [Aphis craccivora]|uniref:Uncharacterized protein n=1 Tax=Aphis craccivora TaxID=307492 RepID=A0A6G0YZJ0_APHCR|nr:hypothetical protein FWK35_00014566 [Aphis craccivora]